MAMKPIGKASIEIVAKGLEQVTQQLEALRVAVSKLTTDTERDVNKATKAAEDGYKKQEKAAEKAAESVERLAVKQAEAAKKAEEIGKAGRTGFGALDDAVGKVGQRIEDSTAGLRRFQGAITGIIGVVGGLVAVGVAGFKKIADEIRQAKEAADSFSGSLRSIRTTGQDAVRAVSGFGETKDALGQLNQLVADQRKAIGEATAQAIADAQKKYEEANPFNPLAEKRARQQLEEDIAKAQADERRQLQRLDEEATRKRAEVAANIEEQKQEEIGRIQDEQQRDLANRTRELRLQALDDVGRAEEELAFKQKQIQNEIAFAGGDAMRVEQLKEILALETQIGQKKVQAARDAAAAESKRQEDKASAELARELRETQRALAEQAKAINENTKEVRGLRERVFNFAPDIRRVAENTNRRTR